MWRDIIRTWLVVEASGRVQCHWLVILDSLVVPRWIQVRNMHEETADESLADVDVVVLAFERGGGEGKLEPGHEAGELLPYAVARLERPAV